MDRRSSRRSVPPPAEGEYATTPGKETDKEASFEESMAELEEVVSRLEAGDAPLEESLALYEKGVAALKRCHGILDRAEQRIRVLVKGPNGQAIVQDGELPRAASGDAGDKPTLDAPAPRRKNTRPPLSSRPQAEGGESPLPANRGSGAGGSLFGGPK
jgi:exodeoxyribonuclease VII small subunit